MFVKSDHIRDIYRFVLTYEFTVYIDKDTIILGDELGSKWKAVDDGVSGWRKIVWGARGG